jgi:hypothetical protein
MEVLLELAMALAVKVLCDIEYFEGKIKWR